MRIVLILPLALLASCTTPEFQEIFGTVPQTPVTEPQTAITAPPPPKGATTVAEFDTTSQADRDAAITTVAASQTRLGTTIASLGSPTEPGIWLKTPLVSALTSGRVEFEGNAINIELRPSGGAAGSGSQISLAAMRLLNAPLTGLPELTVFETAP
jgi:hypothetical protein